MRYVPKISVLFRLPTGAVVGQAYPPGMLLGDAVKRAWPGAPAHYHVLRGDRVLPLIQTLGALGLTNDTELEVVTG